ncbi:MAG: DUF3089 domain-containing protein [Hymenobacter sp.]|nr:MAG: DUF3089 domain-containing protein [Hymenobacter sp.]
MVASTTSHRCSLLSSCLTLIKPVRSFSAAAAGPAPTYADATAWLALPGHASAALLHPPGLPAPAPADTIADVFFVHPTTYFWRLGRWNAPMRLHRLGHYTARTTIRDQASIFAGVGRLYAPRYRQATLYTFFDKENAASQLATELAYTDVKAAFQYYLAHYNRGRPFILAGHSQGGYHLTRLLHELVDNDPPLRKQLVAAYLLGCQAKPDEYQHLPALRDSLQTGGIIAWNTALRGTDYPPYHGLLATNPLTWTLDTTNVPAALNRGGVPLHFRRLDPHVTAAQVHNGLLWADDPHLSGYRRLHVPGLKALSVSYHLVDYNFFYLNVHENARARVRAWQKIH